MSDEIFQSKYLTIRLFGHFYLSQGGQTVALDRRPHVQSLLAYLLLHRQ